MKSQLLVCTILLLGLVGMESLKEEQFQHFWSSISGYSLPAAVLTLQPNNQKSILFTKNILLAAPIGKEIETSSTCILLYKCSKEKFNTSGSEECMQQHTPVRCNYI